jgi:hypothetical protein
MRVIDNESIKDIEILAMVMVILVSSENKEIIIKTNNESVILMTIQL